MIIFESLALLIATLIVIMLLFFGVVWKLLDDIKAWQKSQYNKLDCINTQIAGIWRGQDKIEDNIAILSSIVDKMHRNLCVEIADKMVNKMYPVNEGESLDAPFEQFKIDWDKLSKEQQDEFLKRIIMPNYDKPFAPPFNPTCETTNKED